MTTHAARSWEELIAALHGGLAVVDHRWRIVFASERFGPAIDLDDLLGLDVREVIPALDDDRRGLIAAAEGGAPADVEHSWRDATGGDHWSHVTIVPSGKLGDSLRAVVFARETTATSAPIHRLRAASLELTEVETKERTRVSQDLHDGPIQSLTELVLRLDLSEPTAEAQDLRERAALATSQLRDALERLADEHRPATAGALLERWIFPSTVDSNVALRIDDQLAGLPGVELVQAAFVFIHELVRAARDIGRGHHVSALLTDDRGGVRIDLAIDNVSGRSTFGGRSAAQYRAMAAFAHALGGTIAHTPSEGRNAFTVWLPHLPHSDVPTITERADALEVPGSIDEAFVFASVSELPPLPPEAWEEIVLNGPERVLEVDRDDTFVFASTSHGAMPGWTDGVVLGRRYDDVFSGASLEPLQPAFERLAAGELVDVEWHRENSLGEVRPVRLRMSPRLDDHGDWDGALVVVDDIGDVEYLARLIDWSVADLARARQHATRESIRGIEVPLTTTHDLVERLVEYELHAPDEQGIRRIRLALSESIPRIRTSLSVMSSPDLTTVGFGASIRNSLASLLDGVRFEFDDRLTTAPPSEHAETFFRIAREAVVNAVVHGQAEVVAVRLDESDDAIVLEVRDDGVGIDLAELETTHRHFGTRSMVERATAAGGSCEFARAGTTGTTVTATLPRPTGTRPAPD